MHYNYILIEDGKVLLIGREQNGSMGWGNEMIFEKLSFPYGLINFTEIEAWDAWFRVHEEYSRLSWIF